MFTMKRKKFTTVLTTEDVLDVTLEIRKKLIGKFALNYRALIGDNWEPIYRVDNFHRFLHEQKFWRSPKPIHLEKEKHLSNNAIVDKYTDKIVKNFLKYKSYFKNTQKNQKKKNEKQTNKKKFRKKIKRN